MDDKILHTIMRWCAYQDRSEFETRQKLKSLELNDDEINEIIELLKNENYLNEERFVKNFIYGKFNNKKWGLEKIKHHLIQKHRIAESLINQYAQMISKEEYLQKLKDLVIKKKQQLEKKESDRIILKKKIINFALSKGYDYSSIIEVINQLKI